MKTQRQRDLAKIHIAKKQIGMDEATYRDMLLAVAGVDSAAALDDAGMRRVLQHLAMSGFKGKAGRKTGAAYPGRPKNMDDFERGPMLRKIEALLAEAKRPWDYAHGIAKQMFRTERVEWLPTEDLHRVVSAMVYEARRAGRRTA
ncbi:MAG: regulatory protein GemA [Pseudomonadota bacterium]